ncbi:MAG: TlpA disulfide reductase family protein [Bacteroidota bacterium]|nr:TlpA disulfide reductase family protein [Bacteroidota bacterium]MDP4231855.1 TlpA disulfide reductase family protein [Bacteroidota bacterium]MDP4242741.1 TlpA disulfide reductase family protein [Bacteroidota bacterium]MDP4287192.1 TlpA disulfide reductase family protein [Bacteroidota bacterium]
MTKYLLVTLLALFGNRSQSHPQSRNSIPFRSTSLEIHTKATPGIWVYLLKNQFLNLPREPIDSVQVDNQGIVRFRFIPDPNAWYRLDVGFAELAYGCFALGDSIIAETNPKVRGLQVRYDKIGAFTKQIQYYYHEKWSIPEILKDTSCVGISGYMDSIQIKANRFRAEAVQIRMKFPEHAYFVKDIERWSWLFSQYALATLFASLNQSTIAKCPNYACGWLDTASLNLLDTKLDPADPYLVVSLLIDAQYARLNELHPSASKNYGLDSRFDIATKFVHFARSLAYLYVTEAESNAPPENQLPYIKMMIDTLRLYHESPEVYKSLQAREFLVLKRMPMSPAYAFMLPDSNYKLWTLSDFRGKVILLHFWATWCPPCLKDLPYFQEFERRHIGDTSLACVGISLENHSFTKWKEFLSTQKLSGGIELYGEGVVENETAQGFGFSGFPAYVVINRDGQITASHMSTGFKKDFEREIERAERE